MDGEKLLAAGLLLMTLLPLLMAGPAKFQTLDSDESGNDPELSDWQLGHRLSEELSDRAEAASEGEAPQVQVEATKRLWIAELSEKAEHAEEAADLIDEILSRASSSGLKSLKAACKAMCPKCICGVILLPSLPSYAKATEKHKAPLPLIKPPTPKTTEKPRVTVAATTKPKIAIVATTKVEPVTKKPEVTLTVSLKVTPKPTVAKVLMTSPPLHSIGSNSAKKAKKWLSHHVINLESQLPDFLLDEEGNGNAYKREVEDHDPLSASRSSEIGIE